MMLRLSAHNRPSQTLEGLTSLRGLAATLVLIVHVWGIQPLPESFGIYYVRNFFPLGVAMFFVISAFSLCVSTTHRVGTDGWLSAFAIRRFMRIAPLFYLLSLFYLLVMPMIEGGPFPFLFFFQTISFLFNLMPQEHVSLVWAGWAIGVEMLFYLVLPYVLAFVGGPRSALLVLLAANLISTMFIAHYRGMADYPADYADRSFLGSLGIFAWGILGYFMFRRLSSHRHRPTVAALILAAALLAAAVLVASDGWYSAYPVTRALLWAPAFAGLVLSQCLRPVWPLCNGVWSHLGRMSFSIYLCHPPLVFFLYPVYLRIYAGAPAPEAAFVGCLVLTFILLYPVAWAAFRLVEQPGIRFGEALVRTRRCNDNLRIEALSAPDMEPDGGRSEARPAREEVAALQ